jgi:DNA invertase Pin-like site-specific DNA recombinase
VRLQIAAVGGSLPQGFKMEIPVYTLSAALMVTVFACIAEFERELIRQHTATGRVAAMRRSVRFGRPASLSTDQAALVKRVARQGELTFSLGVVSP